MLNCLQFCQDSLQCPQVKVSDEPLWVPCKEFSLWIKWTVYLHHSNREALKLISFMFPTLGKSSATKFYSPGFQREQWPCFQENSLKHRLAPGSQARGIGQEAAPVPALEQFPLLLWVKHSFTARLRLPNGHSWPWFSLQKEAVVGMILKGRIFYAVPGFVQAKRSALD